jgi:hypothetical protein
MSRPKIDLRQRYAMLALTAASLVDDHVDTTPVRAKKRQDHEDEGQVTIHMRTRLGGGVRIWPSIKLRCRTTGTESKFIHAVGLSPFPTWTRVEPGGAYALLFEALPSSCRAFDLIEDTPQPGGLIVKDIARNGRDVYRLGTD